ncbi:hypothetical protein [Methylobacterium brachythecii]|uniref:Uncharacterized protein n=1 Tax=Methylobacterium brachythecii TaxID=1176177 RepID=A0A7W6F6X5_9HYPH|nr:hypothetical protein [Methylobacterium brachythecii]MBB3902778.1 hypothetical protein [Methylobacterium brachythecii]GLS46982.1 hypothetical protein GCM10007884_49820 [Methylobacterium brachythecii]
MAGPHNVETLVVLQPIAVDTDSSDCKGMLVLANGMLVAVLVQLNHSEEKQKGRWFIEAGFGRLRDLRQRPFDTLDDATRWLRQQMKPNVVNRQS